jgi:hypothetical protein
MLALWIVKSQRPFLTVEDKELGDIFKYLNPTVSLITADSVKSTIMRLYFKGQRDIKDYLAGINSKISFTIDIWTSPNNKSFIAAIAHYIDDNWNIRDLLVDFGLISGRHDGANIADGFFNVLTDYNIASKVWRIFLFLHCYFLLTLSLTVTCHHP